MSNGWERVTKKHPCDICGSDTWCTRGERFWLCMRQAQGGTPKHLASGETGWLHPIAGAQHKPIPRVERAPEPVINVGAMMRRWQAETTRAQRCLLAYALGVSRLALEAFGWVWAREHRAYACPMWDGYYNPVGIRLRTLSGQKWAVKGSHAGCFVPDQEPPNGTLLIVEGPTDACAGFDLGFYPVGRPSCSGGAQAITTLVRRLGFKRAVIIADNDDRQELEKGRNPGVLGACSLAELLSVPSVVVLLPCKDLREFVKLGGTRPVLDSLINASVWRQPQ